MKLKNSDIDKLDNKTLFNYILSYAKCCVCNENYSIPDDEIKLIRQIGERYPDLKKQYNELYEELEINYPEPNIFEQIKNFP